MSLPLEFETRSIPRLLWAYALPAVVSQIIASIYNVADRVILGQAVGPLAIAGLAITLPIMNVIHAFGSLVGSGSAARMSIVLGRKDLPWAEKILGNSLLLTFFFGAIFVGGGYLFMNAILAAFGASPDTIAYAREYMYIVLPGMFLTTLTFNLTGLIRSSGYPTKSMWIMVVGALLNIVLDLLFVLVFRLGIGGAAWATTVSMAVSSILAVAHFIPRESRWLGLSSSVGRRVSASVCFRSHSWAPQGYIVRNILAIGVSPFLMNLAASGVAVVINHQLLHYGGDLAVGAYGIINSTCIIIFLLMMGICQGMQPIAGYNYGAGLTHRLRQTYRLTMAICLTAGILGALICCLFPRIIMRCFTVDPTLIEIGIPAMRLLTIMFPLISFTIINSQFFQSIDKPWIAIVTSLSRQVLFLVPMMFLVPPLFERWGFTGLMGVWSSCTVSDVLGAVLSAVLLYSQRAVFREGYVAPERRPRKERGPKSVLLLAILFLSIPAAQAMPVTQKTDTVHAAAVDTATSAATYNLSGSAPRIGLVLGGGGAKGAAHIGVLRYLEEMGIRPYCIVGTSIGSIIGGMYAMGYSADELEDIISNIDWQYYLRGVVDRSLRSADSRQLNDRLIFSIPFSLRSNDSSTHRRSSIPSSVMGGSNLSNLFASLSIGYHDSISFDSLPIPFACIATDMLTGKEVVLRSGRVSQAIRASMAIPGLFAPVTLDSMVLVDGGMVNNFPVDVCRAMGADIIIGVDVGDELKASTDDLQSLPELLNQLLTIVINGKSRDNLSLCDIYLRPDITGYNTLSFSHDAVDTLVRRGYAVAKLHADELHRLATMVHADSAAIAAPSRRRMLNFYADSLVLADITMPGISDAERSWFMHKTNLVPGHSYTAADLDRVVGFITATGCYRDITYDLIHRRNAADTLAVLGLDSRHDWYDLTLHMQSTPPHRVGLGFRYDTEESASILVDLGLWRNRLSGFHLNLLTRLSYNPRVYAYASLGRVSLLNMGLSYRAGRTDYTVVEPSGHDKYIKYDDHRFSLSVSEFNLRHFIVSAGVSEYLFFYRSLMGDTAVMPRHDNNASLSLYARVMYDNQDNPQIARHGGNVMLYFELGSDTTCDVMTTWHQPLWASLFLRGITHITPGDGAVTVVPSATMRWLFGDDLQPFRRNLVGGAAEGRYIDQQMPFFGIITPHVVGNAALVLRCDIRVALGGKHSLSLIGNYLYHAANVDRFLRFDNADLRGEQGAALRYAYNTNFGPITFDITTSTLHPRPLLYFSFGYQF